MRFSSGFSIFMLAVCSGWIGPVIAQDPQVYEASYQARAAGLSATAERRLERLNDNSFRLSQTMKVRLLGATLGEIEESSQFSFIDGNLTPEHYSYRQSGVSRRKQQVTFDWGNNIADSLEDDEQWQLPLIPGIVDKLSFQLLLRQSVTELAAGELEIQMVDGDEIETHRYRLIGTERVETEMGFFNCLKVERIRAPESNRQTTFWLATDWNLLLVKFEQTRGSGSETELLLKDAVLAGQVVTPLR